MPQNQRRHWLLKTEPTTFSLDDLWNAPGRTTFWDGVRNFQARNILRDQMQPGDLAFIYHSSADPTGVAGIAEVVEGGTPDPTAFDPKDSHYDPKSKRDAPSWYGVRVKAVKKFPRIVPLEELRRTKGLEQMTLLKRGSRLSVQPVTASEWKVIEKLAGR
jgi:predicted RNA-binding protein with PUA-like domain